VPEMKKKRSIPRTWQRPLITRLNRNKRSPRRGRKPLETEMLTGVGLIPPTFRGAIEGAQPEGEGTFKKKQTRRVGRFPAL